MTGMPTRNARYQMRSLMTMTSSLKIKKSIFNATLCMNLKCPPPMEEEWRKLDYWDSGEAILLFRPIPGKSVKQCLCDRERLLQDIIDDVRKVPSIIKNGDTDSTPLTARQQQ
jgi:hypothetical protein